MPIISDTDDDIRRHASRVAFRSVLPYIITAVILLLVVLVRVC